MSLIKNTVVGHFLFLCASTSFIGIGFPGNLSSDSQTIYQAAKAGAYFDHHPPLMAYLWHYFLKIIDGPQLMFVFIMTLLWLGIYLLSCHIFKKTRLGLLCLLIPFIPQIAVYATFIWKDLIFAFGYGLLGLWIAYKGIENKPFCFFESVLFFICLIYTTAVKYQAQFILPVLLLWFFYHQFHKINFKSLSATLVASFMIIGSITQINQYLVNQAQGSNYAWQYKMIYDLSGMSLNTNQMLVPKFLHKHKTITLENLRQKYSLAWEPLIVYPDSPLNATKTPEERDQLKKAWKEAIFHFPLAYLKHRSYIWARGLLFSSPGYGYLTQKFNKASIPPIFSLLLPFLRITAYIFILPLQILFVFWSIQFLKQTAVRNYATAPLFFGIMSLLLLGILYFFSLASVPRYLYLCFYLFFLSCPFMIYCFNHKQ